MLARFVFIIVFLRAGLWIIWDFRFFRRIVVFRVAAFRR